MRVRSYVVAGLLVAIAACSASGAVTEPKREVIEPQVDAGLVDAAPLEDAPASFPDADRPLLCGDAGFCETRLPRTDEDLPLSLRSVWATAPNDVWSVSAEGFVLHHDGTSWTVDYRTHHALHSVWATSTSVWVGGETGLLFRRSATGEWSRIEPGHLAPIRSIYGTSDDDVWFTRDDGSVDHYDGSTMTNHAVDIPGLRITTVFGRPDFSTYAAGHVLGELSELGTFPDRPYAFELAASGLSIVNEALAEKSGFVPISGFVSNSVNPERRIFLVGYERRRETYFGVVRETFHFRHCLFGAGSAVDIAAPDVPGVLNAEEHGYVSRHVLEMSFPGLNYKATDIRIPLHMWQVARWDGQKLTFSSLAMAPGHQPSHIYGAHAGATESWLVGDGFALKGPNP